MLRQGNANAKVFETYRLGESLEKPADIEMPLAIQTRPSKVRKPVVQHALERQVLPVDFPGSGPSSGSRGSRLRHTISRTAKSPCRRSRISISWVHKADLFPVVQMAELYAA